MSAGNGKARERRPNDHDSKTMPDLQAFMPYRLNQLAHLVSRGIAGLYEDQHGLTPAQWRVMAAIAEQPGITAQQVVTMTPMDKVKVSRAVSVLSELGLLERHASNNDGRVALLSLTRKGLKIYRQIAPRAQDYSERLQNRLSEQERQVYLQLTARLIESARELAGD
jgi:DNA-binding MarR family transcriptional regulator